MYESFIENAPTAELNTFLEAPMENFEMLNFNIDFDELIVMIFNDIRNLTIAYVSGKEKSKKFKASKLSAEIAATPPGAQLNTLLAEYEQLLEDIAAEELANMAKKNKICGERPTKYFLRMFKNMSAQKFIGELTDVNTGSSIVSQQKIELEIKDFFQKLYTQSGHQIGSPNEIVDFLPPGCTPPKLTESQADSLEAPISKSEIFAFLDKVNNESSPGFTGITYKFIKAFWSPLGTFLEKAALDIFRKKIFPAPLRHGLISLIPKGDKDKKLLANWRPICLLDSVYKIFSGVLTSRINKVLPSIISCEQSGFVPNRCLNDSLRLLYDTLEWGKSKQQPGIIINADFKKAFDSISFSFITNALAFFGFKENLIEWVKTTQNTFLASMLHSGNISPPFEFQRGVKQGDPLSPALFVISLEILSLRMRHEPLIRGYKMGNFTIVASFFADDGIFILDRHEPSVKKAVGILNSFAQISGLYIQPEKTGIIQFGVTAEFPFCPEIPFKRVKSFKYLGMKFTANLSGMEVNIEDKLDEIKEIARCWKYKNLSVYGKCLVANTMMMSKIYNIISIIPHIKKEKLENFEEAIYDFIWDGKDSVRRFDAKISEQNGGLNLPCVFTAVKSFKLSWFRRLFMYSPIWSGILNELIKNCSTRNRTLSLESLLNLGDMGWIYISNKIKSTFWKSCFKNVSSPSREYLKLNPESLLVMSIWENSFLKQNDVELHPSFFPSLQSKVSAISDFVNPTTGHLYTATDFIRERGNVYREHFDQISSAIHNLLLRHNIDINNLRVQLPSRPFWYLFFTLSKKGCRCWSRYLRLYKSDNIRIREEMWEEKLGKNMGPIFWDSVYKNTKTICFNNKIKFFQYQINRGVLKTNNVLTHFVENQSNLCTFCQLHIETIIHLFWDCPIVNDFYNQLSVFFNSIRVTWPPVNREKFLFGNSKDGFLSLTEYTYLYLKYFIWCTRCTKNELSLAAFKNKFKVSVTLDILLLDWGGRERGGEGEREGGVLLEEPRAPNILSFLGTLGEKLGIG